MFVGDPLDLFKTLCKMQKQNISRNSFIVTYKKIKEKEKKEKIGSKTPDTHIGTLHYYDLIKQDPDKSIGNYKITKTGSTLCKLLKQRKKEELKFQQFLKTLIFSQPQKGPIFEGFLKFIAKKRTEREIRKKYKWTTGLTLIAWSILSGLAWKSGDYVVVATKTDEVKTDIAIEDSWKIFL